MDALNILRAVLVACAFVAAVILTTTGQWVPAAVLFVGIAVHLVMFVYLRGQRRRFEETQGMPTDRSAMSSR